MAHNRKTIVVPIDLTVPGMTIVSKILARAEELGEGESMTHHLVGAKLAIRFPGHQIEMQSFSDNIRRTDGHGNFLIGASVFHVTTTAQPHHFRKCVQNLKSDLRPYLLVPERRLNKARADFAEYGLARRAALRSIESFIGQNLDEMGGYDNAGLGVSVAALLAEYNRRVHHSGASRGLLIQIPESLQS